MLERKEVQMMALSSIIPLRIKKIRTDWKEKNSVWMEVCILLQQMQVFPPSSPKRQ